MKITFLTEEWTQSTEGSCSTFMRKMAIELSRLENVEIGIFIPSASPEDKEDARKYNIKVFEGDKTKGLTGLDSLLCPPEGFSTDYIITYGSRSGCLGFHYKRGLSCKWVHAVLKNAEEMAMFKKTPRAFSEGQKQHETEVKLCKMADMVITVGSKVHEAFSPALGQCKKDHIFNLIPGIFDEFFGEQRQYQNSRTFKILVFGGGNTEDFELEGLHVAAKAVVELNEYEPSYILKVVGPREGEQEKLVRRLEGLGVSRSQLLVTSLDGERRKLAAIFFQVDLVLMPSGTEAFGLIALEALSAGVPILITCNSGLAEALEEVYSGNRCIVYQADDWAKEIRMVRRNLKIRLQEANVLRDNYKGKYCWMDQCAAFVTKLRALHPG